MQALEKTRRASESKGRQLIDLFFLYCSILNFSVHFFAFSSLRKNSFKRSLAVCLPTTQADKREKERKRKRSRLH
jgi:hypothetical protein